MSTSGRRALEGFTYQAYIALDWLVEMIHRDRPDPIDVISVDSVGLLDAEQMSPQVDDIVIRLESGDTLYVQAKKGQTDRKSWSLADTTLQKELRSACVQLEEDEEGQVRFYSRDPFGEIHKLAEACRRYPNYNVFEAEASDTLIDTLDKLSALTDRTEKQAFELIQQIDFKSTKDFEEMERDLVRRLGMAVSDPETALRVLRSFLTKHTTGQAHTQTSVHEIRRDHVVSTLEEANLRLDSRLTSYRDGCLISHDEQISRLESKKHESFLLSDNLEFVEPEGKKYRPDRILDGLNNPNSADGLFIVGPGGVGKTRTLLQTAERAHERDNWQVLHAVTTGKLDNKTLEDELPELSHKSKDAKNGGNYSLLLIIDEPSNSNLDFHDINEKVIYDYNNLKILSSLRPSNYVKCKERKLDSFNDIWMNPDDAPTKKVSRLIQQEVASDAIEILGPEMVNHLCGDRPAIALFIAQKLNRLAKKGKLNPQDIQDIDSGDLSEWLNRRLGEDRLRTEMDEEGFPEATSQLLTAAAVLGAAPAERPDLLEVAESLLSEIPNTSNPYGKARRIVEDHLEEPRWIEQQELGWQGSSQKTGGLGPPHDVVTDELLDKIFLDEYGAGAPPEERLEQLLSPCANNLVAWSNMTKSLGRLRGRIQETSDQDGRLEETFSAKTDEWLQSNVSKLSNSSFKKSETIEWEDNFTYSNAISASLEAGLWSDDLLIQELALPWLRKEGREYPLARFLLVKLLNMGHERDVVVEEALEWFENHTHDPDAAYILYLAAKQLDGKCEKSKTAADLGVDWFESERRQSEGGLWNGQFILTELLQWDEKHRVDDLVDWAFRWLGKFADQRRARYVIHTLLKQVYSDERTTPEKLKVDAFNWLGNYGVEIQANQVISPLLENGNLEGGALKKAIDYAQVWLSDSNRVLSAEARYVLQSTLEILRKEDRGAFLFRKIDPIDKSLAWLDKYWNTDNDEIKVELVIEALLHVTGSDDEDTFKEALRYSFSWLEEHGDEERAQHVYTRILRHSDVEDDAKSETTMLALQWLRDHTSSEKRDFVINSLLLNWGFVPTAEERNDVVEAAFDVASEVIEGEKEAVFSSEEAKEVLVNVIDTESDRVDDAKCLLRELGYDPQEEVYRANFERLSTTISNTIEQMEVGSTERVQLLEKGADLLCDPRTYKYHCKGWHHLLGDILDCNDLKNSDRERIIRALREEVCNQQASCDTRWSFGYQILFNSTSNPRKDDELMKTGFDWLQANFQHKSWPDTYKFMIDHCAMVPELRNRLIGIGKTWLSEDGKEQRDHWGDVYDWILSIRGLNEDKKKDILRKAFEFIENYRKHDHWEQVFKKTNDEIDKLGSDIDGYKNMLNNAALSTKEYQ